MENIESCKQFASELIKQNLYFKDSVIELLTALSLLSLERGHSYNDVPFIKSMLNENRYFELFTQFDDLDSNSEAFLAFKLFQSNSRSGEAEKAYNLLKILL